jgi:hypothetical protein
MKEGSKHHKFDGIKSFLNVKIKKLLSVDTTYIYIQNLNISLFN